jgi:hypothetical protein
MSQKCFQVTQIHKSSCTRASIAQKVHTVNLGYEDLRYRDTPKHVPAKVVLCYPRLLIRTLAYMDTKMLVPTVSLYPRFTVVVLSWADNLNCSYNSSKLMQIHYALLECILYLITQLLQNVYHSVCVQSTQWAVVSLMATTTY